MWPVPRFLEKQVVKDEAEVGLAGTMVGQAVRPASSGSMNW
jgi:hypothetical protein